MSGNANAYEVFDELRAKYAKPVLDPIVEGMANHMYVAAKNPNTPCTGFAAIRLCHEAWSQKASAAVANTP